MSLKKAGYIYFERRLERFFVLGNCFFGITAVEIGVSKRIVRQRVLVDLVFAKANEIEVDGKQTQGKNGKRFPEFGSVVTCGMPQVKARISGKYD